MEAGDAESYYARYALELFHMTPDAFFNQSRGSFIFCCKVIDEIVEDRRNEMRRIKSKQRR